jgi:hypothetical protein
MQLGKSNRLEDTHIITFESRREAFRVARAAGLWRYGSLGLIVRCIPKIGDMRELAVYVHTPDLEALADKLQSSTPVLQAYLGQTALSAEAIVERITFPEDDWHEVFEATAG